MIFLFIVVLLSWVMLFAMQSRTSVRKCFSRSCRLNVKGKCTKKEIDVYDNGVIGLCLWHTAKMNERILEPFRKGIEIGQKDLEIALIDEIKDRYEKALDKSAVIDPQKFEVWMRNHMKDKEKK